METFDSSEILSQPRNVKFHSQLKVVLIPSVSDYSAAGLTNVLWWKSTDYKTFQEAAASELKMLSICEGIELSLARKILYQPQVANSPQQQAASSIEDALGVTCYREDALKSDDSPMNPSSPLSPTSPSSRTDIVYTCGSQSNQLTKRSSDGNLHHIVDSTMSSNRTNTKSNRSRNNSFDEALLSLCVPLTDLFPLSSKEKRSSSKKRNAKWLKEVGLGIAFSMCLALVLIPTLVGVEKWVTG